MRYTFFPYPFQKFLKAVHNSPLLDRNNLYIPSTKDISLLILLYVEAFPSIILLLKK